MSCVFCDIVDGRATAAHVMSDAHAVAFLDKTPLFHGHVLVVPRQHVETLHDLELSEVGPLFERVHRQEVWLLTALVAAGCLLTFILCLGYYITPALVGGPTDQMISGFIASAINTENNWGKASALGVILLVATLILYYVYNKLIGIDRMKLG